MKPTRYESDLSDLCRTPGDRKIWKAWAASSRTNMAAVARELGLTTERVRQVLYKLECWAKYLSSPP